MWLSQQRKENKADTFATFSHRTHGSAQPIRSHEQLIAIQITSLAISMLQTIKSILHHRNSPSVKMQVKMRLDKSVQCLSSSLCVDMNGAVPVLISNRNFVSSPSFYIICFSSVAAERCLSRISSFIDWPNFCCTLPLALLVFFLRFMQVIAAKRVCSCFRLS